MEATLVKEITGYFQQEQSILGLELRVKEKEHKEAVEYLTKLPFVSLLRQPLKSILKRVLPTRAKRLEKEIDNLKQKIARYAQAETELKEGKYELAIALLPDLADRFFYPAFPAPTGLDTMGGGISSMPNPMFFRIIDLQDKLKELISLKGAGVTS